MGESFLKELEDKLAAKAEFHRKVIQHVRKVYAESTGRHLADLRDTEYKLEQVRKARGLLEAAEGNES